MAFMIVKHRVSVMKLDASCGAQEIQTWHSLQCLSFLSLEPSIQIRVLRQCRSRLCWRLSRFRGCVVEDCGSKRQEGWTSDCEILDVNGL
jgi:hypothetical protein